MTAALSLSVELCGRLADAAGPLVSVSIPAAGCSIAALTPLLAAAHPALAEMLATMPIRACVDEAIVGDDTHVRPGQLVALFPPVSGG